ncbi:MAG: DUF4097 domain-containing protein [Candidatus Aminicenantes bacterium]|nr:DUF4097 domain-containing protein [Candidatus Aminicenantes bacterium]MDH5705359.1 DUF4097 domain-containing protein [Candidatus Aminicenantes bacterium]
MIKIIRKNVFFTVFMAVFALLTTACLVYGVAGDTIEKSFQVKPGGKLILETDIGSIEVYSGNTNTLELEVLQEAKTASSSRAERILEDFEVSFRQSGDTVYVTGEYRKGSLSRFWNNIGRYIRVKFQVTVPQEFNVDLKTRGGSISVDDLKGDVHSNTSGGSLTFSRIDGPVYGRTSGGSIKLTSCSGNADVKTSGGSITLGDVSGDVIAYTSGGSIKVGRAKGSVDVHTSGGGIHVEEAMGAIKAHTSGGSITAYVSDQPESDCSLTTSGGSITVHLAERIGLDLNARASGGRVYTEFPVMVSGEISKSSLKAKINEGGPELYLYTSGGSIYIKKAD